MMTNEEKTKYLTEITSEGYEPQGAIEQATIEPLKAARANVQDITRQLQMLSNQIPMLEKQLEQERGRAQALVELLVQEHEEAQMRKGTA